MKRRSFFSVLFLLLGIMSAGLAASSIRTGEVAGYGYAVAAVVYIAVAGGYQLHPTPVSAPDEPAPRQWFEISGIIVATLVISAILLVAIG